MRLYVKLFNYLFSSLSYIVYLFMRGVQDKLIDLDNEKLATEGKNKVCVGMDQKQKSYITGEYTQYKIYVDGNPQTDPRHFIEFFEFLKRG